MGERSSTSSADRRSRSPSSLCSGACRPSSAPAFLLREVFDEPYNWIAEIVGTSDQNACQLVTRACRHVQERFPSSSPRASSRSSSRPLLGSRGGERSRRAREAAGLRRVAPRQRRRQNARHRTCAPRPRQGGAHANRRPAWWQHPLRRLHLADLTLEPRPRPRRAVPARGGKASLVPGVTRVPHIAPVSRDHDHARRRAPKGRDRDSRRVVHRRFPLRRAGATLRNSQRACSALPGGKQVVCCIVSKAEADQRTLGPHEACAMDDQQELGHRGRWLLQSAIAEVARRDQSRSPPRPLSAPEIRQSRDAARRRPSSRCVDQRGVLLWHELGCASSADSAARRRLPIASFVPASKRTALVVLWGSEHLADWPRGFRSGRSGEETRATVEFSRHCGSD
jgi:hypothetical protein